MTPLDSSIRHLIESGSLLALPPAFLLGLMTVLQPCVLVMAPLMIGFVGGLRERTSWKTFLYPLLFVLGYSLQLAVLFTAMAWLSKFVKTEAMMYFLGGVCLLAGLNFLGVFDIGRVVDQRRLPRSTGMVGALLLGFFFGAVSLPCTGGALALILSQIPLRGHIFGGMLLLAFGLGQCVVVLAAGCSMAAAKYLIESRPARASSVLFRRAAASLLIAFGLYLIWTA